MNGNLSGKLWLLALILFFAAWCWISTRHELKLEAKLETARTELKKTEEAHKATIESLQRAHEAQERIHNEMAAKKRGLELSLEAEIDWSGLAIPDDVLAGLRERAATETYNFLPSGDVAGRCEDTVKSGDENDRRHGAAFTGGRGGDAPQKRANAGAAGISGKADAGQK